MQFHTVTASPSSVGIQVLGCGQGVGVRWLSPMCRPAAMCLHVASPEARGAASRRLGGPGWGGLGPDPPCASVAALAASTMPLAGSLLLRAAALDGADGAGFDVDGACLNGPRCGMLYPYMPRTRPL